MSDVVEKLWELQLIVLEIAEREKKLESKPETFAEIDSEFENANEGIAVQSQRLEELGKERRTIEGDLQDQQELLKKYQGQLMQVKNQQQYAAAWKEIDMARRRAKELEDEALKRMTEIDSIEGEISGGNAAHEELAERHRAEYEKWQGSLGGQRAELEKVRQKAANLETQIPEKIRAEFYRILKSRQGIAVAKVSNDACGMCRVRVRPQLSQQLKRGELITCEGCRRIMYLDRVTS